MSGALLTLFPWVAAAAAVVAVAMYIHDGRQHSKNQHFNSYGNKKPPSTSFRSSTTSRSPNTKIKNPCKICGSEIKNLEDDLTKLPCNHEFHENCIKFHIKKTASQLDKIALCPVPSCQKKFSLKL